MDEKLIELYVQRGRLRERITAQRGQLARELAPVGTALHTVDRTRVVVQETRVWLQAHPAVVAGVVVALLVWRPRAVFRTLLWGFTTWRKWARWREWIQVGARTI